MTHNAKTKVQELFDKAQLKRRDNPFSLEDVFGRRVLAETDTTLYFLFDNEKIIIKQSVYKSDDRNSDLVELYSGLCNFLFDAINEIE